MTKMSTCRARAQGSLIGVVDALRNTASPARWRWRMAATVRLISLDGYPSIELAGPLTIVGRHGACNATVPSSHVSRRHCCLAPDGAAWVVRDLGSTNGIR